MGLYEKQQWQARLGIGLNKYKNAGTLEDMILTPDPDSVTQEGTPFSADRMNHMEDGIEKASNYSETRSVAGIVNNIVSDIPTESMVIADITSASANLHSRVNIAKTPAYLSRIVGVKDSSATITQYSANLMDYTALVVVGGTINTNANTITGSISSGTISTPKLPILRNSKVRLYQSVSINAGAPPTIRFYGMNYGDTDWTLAESKTSISVGSQTLNVDLNTYDFFRVEWYFPYMIGGYTFAWTDSYITFVSDTTESTVYVPFKSACNTTQADAVGVPSVPLYDWARYFTVENITLLGTAQSLFDYQSQKSIGTIVANSTALQTSTATINDLTVNITYIKSDSRAIVYIADLVPTGTGGSTITLPAELQGYTNLSGRTAGGYGGGTVWQTGNPKNIYLIGNDANGKTLSIMGQGAMPVTVANYTIIEAWCVLNY